MKKVLLFLCGIICMLFVSRYVFERLHLYEEFFWLDIPMHFIGGFLLFGFFSSLFYPRKRVDILIVLSLFFLVASIWELYEYFIREVTERSLYGVLDTVKDYCVGVCGLLCGYYVVIKK